MTILDIEELMLQRLHLWGSPGSVSGRGTWDRRLLLLGLPYDIRPHVCSQLAGSGVKAVSTLLVE